MVGINPPVEWDLRKARGNQRSAGTSADHKEVDMDSVTGAANQASRSIRDYLGEVRFPCGKGELVEELRQHDAPNPIIDQIERTDVDQFDSLADVQAILTSTAGE